jgi:choline-sulfatase
MWRRYLGIRLGAMCFVPEEGALDRQERRRPNILLVVVDQLTAALTGAYGHSVVRTPNLDCLVSEGVRFDAAYSNCPVCAPARGALLSGCYVSNCKTFDNAAPWPEDMVTLPHYLTLQGYDTVLSGKMHFVGADQLHGFRKRFVHNIYPADFKWTMPRQDPFQLAEGEALAFRPTGGQAGQYVGDAIHVGEWRNTLSYDEEAHFRALEYLHARGAEGQRAAYVAAREFEELDTIRGTGRGSDATAAPGAERHAGGAQPFFLCVSYHHPHEPFWPPQRYWDIYEGQPIDVPARPDSLDDTYSMQDRWLNDYHGCSDYDLTDPKSASRVRRAYYGLVTYIDDKVGELMASLAENGFADNTVVLFCSDHGDMLCEKGMVQKRSFYEWSARVPLIVRFPDRWQAGRTVDAPVSLIDILPTCLDIAGVEERLPYDGKSLMGLLDGSDTAERVAFAEVHSEGIHGPCFMIRRGRFKYIYVYGHDEQLFDLATDPGEWNNLADDPSMVHLKENLRGRILATFDPEAIDREVQASIRRRQMIREAMNLTKTRWDVSPHFDGSKDTLSQYLH